MYGYLGALPTRRQILNSDPPSSASPSETEPTSPNPMLNSTRSSTFTENSTSSTNYTNYTNHTSLPSTHFVASDSLSSGSVSSPDEPSWRPILPRGGSVGASSTQTAQSAQSDSRFDSLQDLLERAGYKETRVVTPDRLTLAEMVARKLSTPPKKPRLVDDFTDDEPSLAADELRRAAQRFGAGWSDLGAATSKSLPTRNIKIRPSSETPPSPAVPTPPAPSSSWFSGLWFFGPGSIGSNPAAAPTQDDANSFGPTSILTSDKSMQASEAQASQNASAAQRAAKVAPPSTASSRTASHNQVWRASVAYRSAKSRTAPVRRKAAAPSTSNDLLNSDAAADQRWRALQKAGANGIAKRRPGLVDAFTSPTKKTPSDQSRQLQDSPSRQRKWRQERAAWKESLGDLQAMMDNSKMRREAAAATAAAAAVSASAAGVAATVVVEQDGSAQRKVSSLTFSLQAGPEDQDGHVRGGTSAQGSATSRAMDDDAVAKLLSGPALPFLTTDPAVAPRNGACTKPAHLSVRRMKSVEMLFQIMRERRTVSASSAGAPPEVRSTFDVDAAAGQISPKVMKRSTPPRLTVSSPRGISSPRELELEGQEFEPMSWSPAGMGSAVVISHRRVQKKARSKLRHVSSGSDLRSEAGAGAGGLEMPRRSSRRGRSKSRSSPDASTTKEPSERSPVAALLQDSVGTLSRGSKVRALRSNVHVLDDESTVGESGDGSIGVDESPTRMRSKLGSGKQSTPSVLSLDDAGGRIGHRQPSSTAAQDDDGDIFQPSPQPRHHASRTATVHAPYTLRRKDFTARLTKTSKIMRLIEEAENIPSIASLISNPPPQAPHIPSSRQPLQHNPATPQNILPHRPQNPPPSALHEGLSSSLSKKSRNRMHNITRVLGQHQPAV